MVKSCSGGVLKWVISTMGFFQSFNLIKYVSPQQLPSNLQTYTKACVIADRIPQQRQDPAGCCFSAQIWFPVACVLCARGCAADDQLSSGGQSRSAGVAAGIVLSHASPGAARWTCVCGGDAGDGRCSKMNAGEKISTEDSSLKVRRFGRVFGFYYYLKRTLKVEYVGWFVFQNIFLCYFHNSVIEQ